MKARRKREHIIAADVSRTVCGRRADVRTSTELIVLVRTHGPGPNKFVCPECLHEVRIHWDHWMKKE